MKQDRLFKDSPANPKSRFQPVRQAGGNPLPPTI